MELGTFQELEVIKVVDFGVYLGDGSGEKVLLPKKEVPEDAEKGKVLRVFLYRDSKDRPIATLREPKVVMGKAVALRVKEVGKIGAFLDWGLEKDLFLPYREMTAHLKPEDEVLVRLYVDKSGRLAASMKHLYPLLSTRSPYRPGDEAKARIYEFGHDYGTFVAVDDLYSGMIPRHEDVSDRSIGEVVPVHVVNVKEDGKLDVTLRDKGYRMLEGDAARVLSIIESYAGVLPFTEKADPEVIQRETGLSKNAFKRAVGHLYKERIVTIEEGRIRKVTDPGHRPGEA